MSVFRGSVQKYGVFLFLRLRAVRELWYTDNRMDMRMERIYHTPGWTGGSCL